MSDEKRMLTPQEAAHQWGVSVQKIRCFIRTGELRAINSALPGRNRRPRYLIDRRDLEDLERRRAVVASSDAP